MADDKLKDSAGESGWGGDKSAKSWGDAADKGGEKPPEPKAESKADVDSKPDKPESKEDKPEAPKEVAVPDGWGKAKGVRAWSEGKRADNPDKRQLLAPTAKGIGDGQVFQFLFGLKIHAPNDRRLFEMAREHINDDVEVLRQAGYTVVIDEEAVHDDFIDGIYGTAKDIEGLKPVGLFWLAHGHEDGAIETCDGGHVKPDDVDPAKVHGDLRLVVFAACYTGSCSRTWRKALGGKPLVVGWGRPVTIDRAVDFLTPDDKTETDLDDLIRRYMLSSTPVPAEVELRYSPVDAAASAGRSTDLEKRLEGTLSILHAKRLSPPPGQNNDGALDIDVPVDEEPPPKDAPEGTKPRRRWHRAKVFIVDGAEPFVEGELILGVECDVGELSSVVDIPMLLAGIPDSRYAKATLVNSEKEMPRIVTQGFMPLARVRDMDAAALIFHVCRYADVLEKRIFGGDAN